MLHTDMANTGGQEKCIFRPWGEKEDSSPLTNTLERDRARSTSTPELALNLSKDRSSPKSDVSYSDIRTRSPESIVETKPNPELSPIMKRTGLQDINPALFKQIQMQNYLQTLQFQLLAMSRMQSESPQGILHVHQQALLNAQIQQAQRHMLQPTPMVRRQCSAPVQPEVHRHAPTSPLFPRPSFQSEPNSPVNNNVGHFPLPSAKDGEPLDLLPKSLYLNKSQGGHLCIFCGKVYSRKYGLKIHLRTHTGYKPLKCKVCARPFGDPSNLNKHIRLHAEGETPYRCEHCGKVLVRRRDLERHIRSRHPDEAVNLPPEGEGCGEVESEHSCQDQHMDELDVVG